MTKNFTLKELIGTHTFINNMPNEKQTDALLNLTENLLQPIRDIIGRMKINSGFRSLALNTFVLGVVNSQHMKGEAADFVPLNMDLKDAYNLIGDNFTFDQLILYPTFIHISLCHNRQQNWIKS